MPASDGDWVEVQAPVSRADSLRARLSSACWRSGLETFFSHAIPFSYSTGRTFASRVVRILVPALQRRLRTTGEQGPLHVYEFGSGLGVLAAHILDLLREEHPDLYARIHFHVTDRSQAMLEEVRRLGVLEDHSDRVDLGVLDVLRPAFQPGQEPALVLQSYLVDSLPTRHLEVAEGEVFEILVRTEMSRAARLVDASRFPPRVVGAEPVVESLLSSREVLSPSLLSQMVELLREEYVRVPVLDSPGMSVAEREEIQAFVATLEAGVTTSFNHCFPYVETLRQLISGVGPQPLVLVHDFGHAVMRPSPETGHPSACYGATISHSVCFPHLVHVAERAGAGCLCTANADGESQILFIDPGGIEGEVEGVFRRTFDCAGYERVRDALTACTQIDEADAEFPATARAIVSSLSEVEGEDYALSLGLTSELLRRGFHVQAAVAPARCPLRYRDVAVDTYLLAGIACRKLGALERAEFQLRKALAIYPSYPLAQAELSHVLLQQGRQEEHLVAAIASLQGLPDDALWEQVVLVVIGLLVQGRTGEGREAVTSVVETSRRHPEMVPDFVARKLLALPTR